MRTFTRKWYGRIYVLSESDIDKVKNKIREIDDFEYDYLPEDLIQVYDWRVTFEYTWKFDSLDLDRLTIELWEDGVYIMCIDNWNNE